MVKPRRDDTPSRGGHGGEDTEVVSNGSSPVLLWPSQSHARTGQQQQQHSIQLLTIASTVTALPQHRCHRVQKSFYHSNRRSTNRMTTAADTATCCQRSPPRDLQLPATQPAGNEGGATHWQVGNGSSTKRGRNCGADASVAAKDGFRCQQQQEQAAERPPAPWPHLQVPTAKPSPASIQPNQPHKYWIILTHRQLQLKRNGATLPKSV